MNPDDFLWNLLTGKSQRDLYQQVRQNYAGVTEPRNPGGITPPISPLPIQGINGRLAAETPTQPLPSLPIKGIPIPKRDNDIDEIQPDLTQLGGNPQPKKPNMGLMAGMGFLGDSALALGNMERPDAPLGALGGALKGASIGMLLGPAGAGVGAAIGGLSGFAATGINRGMYDQRSEDRADQKIKAATVYGGDMGSFAQGGNVGGSEGEMTPIQTERGERIVMPDGSIFKSKATKTHKQMDRDEVTDVLPPDAYVASAQKKIFKKKADKLSLGFDMITYDEEGNGTKPKENFLGDIMSKKKMTAADVIELVRKKFPITDMKHDPFAKKANILNLQRRLPYINAVISQVK